MANCPHCQEFLTEEFITEACNIIPPVGRDDFKQAYLSWDYLDQVASIRGFSTDRVRRSFKALQRLTWVYIPGKAPGHSKTRLAKYEDATIAIVRVKDLTGRRAFRKFANCPLNLPYMPTTIVDLKGNPLTNLTERQAWAMRTEGRPKLGDPKTVSYIDRDTDPSEEQLESWGEEVDNAHEGSDYNGPQYPSNLHLLQPCQVLELKQKLQGLK